MTEVLLRKEMGGAKPASEDAHRIFSNIKSGQEFVADVRDPRRRSTEQHRFWFKMITLIYDNSEAIQKQCGDFETFRELLLIELGYHRAIKRRNGTIHYSAKSVAFHKMEQAEFNELVSKTLEWAAVIGFDPDTLSQEAA